MRICFLIRRLNRGGAQTQCLEMARGLKNAGHDVRVVVFYSGGELELVAARYDVPVFSLRKRGRWSLVGPVFRLSSLISRVGFEVVYSWLPMENLVGLAVARFKRIPIVWGIRAAGAKTDQFGLPSRVLHAFQRLLLSMPDAVVSNSRAALRELGLNCDERVRWIGNGVDTERFKPDSKQGAAFRRDFAFDPADELVAIVARLDEMKDHRTFLRAAQIVLRTRPGAKFLIVGSGSQDYTISLRQEAVSLGIDRSVFWLGDISAVERVYNGIDVIVSSSSGEGLPNVILESMACGCSPVVTDVGDSAQIVGSLGIVVPPRSPDALASGVVSALVAGIEVDDRLERRLRICSLYRFELAVERTADVLLGVRRLAPKAS